MKGKFTIGSTVYFGGDKWTVVKYHKVGSHWEVMFRSEETGVHQSIACVVLEEFA